MFLHKMSFYIKLRPACKTRQSKIKPQLNFEMSSVCLCPLTDLTVKLHAVMVYLEVLRPTDLIMDY